MGTGSASKAIDAVAVEEVAISHRVCSCKCTVEMRDKALSLVGWHSCKENAHDDQSGVAGILARLAKARRLWNGILGACRAMESSLQRAMY